MKRDVWTDEGLIKSADSQDLQETPDHLRKNTFQVKHFKMSTRNKRFRIETFSGKNVFKKEKRKNRKIKKKVFSEKKLFQGKKDFQEKERRTKTDGLRLLMLHCESWTGLGTCRSWVFVLDSDLTVFNSELVGPDLRCSES